MKRIQGGIDAKVLMCINPRLQKWLVRWDFQPTTELDEETGKERIIGKNYQEKLVLHKPTMEEVKEIVLTGMNAKIDERILSGFVWNGMEIWLSSENQFNYKAAYDLAVQTGGANLPTTFKFGTTERPVYHTFTTVEELMGFYVSAMKYINDVLAEGWKEKDAMDWSEYERLLDI